MQNPLRIEIRGVRQFWRFKSAEVLGSAIDAYMAAKAAGHDLDAEHASQAMGARVCAILAIQFVGDVAKIQPAVV